MQKSFSFRFSVTLLLMLGTWMLFTGGLVRSGHAHMPVTNTPLTVSLNPIPAVNGHAMLLEIDGRHRRIDPDRFVVHLDQRRIPLMAHPAKPEGVYFAILGISYHASKGMAALLLEWSDRFGDHYQTVPYRVVDGHYRSERLTVSAAKVSPSARALKRIRNEKNMLRKIYAAGQRRPTWHHPFQEPVQSEMTSPYGSKRLFNGTLKSYHNGVDFRAALGTPVYAANDGVVRMADDLFYSGNLILIDHGMDMFTQYAHLSKIQVQPGQRVEKGQLIGFSGATGRITGPHLHWGVKINGVNVDPIQLIAISEMLFASPTGGQTIANGRTAAHPPTR